MTMRPRDRERNHVNRTRLSIVSVFLKWIFERL